MNLRFRLIILSISSLLILGQMKAQGKQQLPHREKYVRVSDFGKLPVGARYLIGVKNEDNKIYFLSSITYKIGKGGKLTATLTEHIENDTVFSPAPEICWQIEEKEKKAQWCITSIKEEKYLNYNNKDQTGVYLDSKRVYWDLTLLGEGQIKLSNTVGHSTRYLGFNPIQGENNGYFGNYKTCQSDTLLIFMHDLTLSEKKGELQLPADSDRIAFLADTLIDGRLPQSEYLLSDGRVAADGFDTWTYLTASQKAFYLQSLSSAYLRHDLSQGEKQLWYYWNGLISTSEDTPRCLVWDKKQGQLTVVDPYEAEVSSFIPIYFAEKRIIKNALKLRGIDVSFTKPIKRFEYYIVPTLFRASNIANEMTESAYTRCAMCTDNMNSIYYKKFDMVDFILIVMLILLVASWGGGFIDKI